MMRLVHMCPQLSPRAGTIEKEEEEEEPKGDASASLLNLVVTWLTSTTAAPCLDASACSFMAEPLRTRVRRAKSASKPWRKWKVTLSTTTSRRSACAANSDGSVFTSASCST